MTTNIISPSVARAAASVQGCRSGSVWWRACWVWAPPCPPAPRCSTFTTAPRRPLAHGPSSPCESARATGMTGPFPGVVYVPHSCWTLQCLFHCALVFFSFFSLFTFFPSYLFEFPPLIQLRFLYSFDMEYILIFSILPCKSWPVPPFFNLFPWTWAFLLENCTILFFSRKSSWFWRSWFSDLLFFPSVHIAFNQDYVRSVSAVGLVLFSMCFWFYYYPPSSGLSEGQITWTLARGFGLWVIDSFQYQCFSVAAFWMIWIMTCLPFF